MKSLNFKFVKLIAVLFSIFVCFVSCKSNNVEISDNLTFSQLIQRGQDAAANENYLLADKYFVACLDRYGSDLKSYVEARYELATSNLKQKKYLMAETIFTEILEIYDTPEAMYQVQSKFKRLSQIQLDKINEIKEKQVKKN